MKFKINIDSSIECSAFEDIDINEGKIKISYIEFEGNLVLLDKSYYMTKKNFESEGKVCLPGKFDCSKLDFGYEPMEPAKEFVISINGDCKFNGDEENKKFNKINNKKVEALFVSFVSDRGV
jgi:hypothetical protein